MTFVVEDGSGVANANAYVSEQFYRDYHTLRGRDVSAQTQPEVEAFIVRATDYIEKRFAERWKGSRSTEVQSLSFPRESVTVDGVTFASDALPVLLTQAAVEYAFRASLYFELAPDPPVPFDRDDNAGGTVSGGGALVAKREKVGPIEEQSQFADLSRTSTKNKGSGTVPSWAIPTYPAADMLIEKLLRGRAGRTIRA